MRRSLSASTHASESLELDLEETPSVVETEPQLLIQLAVHPPATQEAKERSDHVITVSLASARVNVLPRTLLRLEHFGAETLVTVRRRAYQLEAQYKPRMIPPSSTARNHVYLDGMREFAESRGGVNTESSQAGLTGVVSGRKDSVSDSVKDSSGKKLVAYASPRNQSVAHHEDRTGKLTANNLSSSVHAAVAEREREGDEALEGGLEFPLQEERQHVETTPEDDARRCVWTVRVELSNLSLWLLSTDKKADAAGVKLAANVRAELAAFSGDRYPVAALRKELRVGSAEIRNIELSINSPVDERLEVESKAVRGVHFPWTIVEPFNVRADYKSSFCIRPTAADNTGDTVVLKEALLTTEKTLLLADDSAKQVPDEWTDWVAHEPSVDVDRIASRVSYRNLPVLLQVASSLTSVASAEEKIRGTYVARMKALEEELGWEFTDEPHGESSYYLTLSERDDEGSEVPDELQERESSGCFVSKHAVTQASLQLSGLQFQVINNIVDQASPVLGFNIGHLDASHFSTSDAALKLSLATTLDAWYHNLRLVASEPLIEPWKVDLVVSRQASAKPTLEEAAVNDDSQALQLMPVEVKIQSSETLQLNVTEAFIANMMAATRAWEWVVHEGGDPREMTEYSTYWIRNTTGLNLHYWGKACKPSTLVPGGEEPMEFVESESEDVQLNHLGGAPLTREDDYQRSGAERAYSGGNRQIFVAVFEDEEATNDAQSVFEKKWQSETAISVDQVDSRMYALVNADMDIFSAKLRKCECVIDVLVERGRKVFVVRSTLLLENKTGSDLEVEFVPPPAQYVSPQSTPDVSPIWRSVVRASSVVPVPLHLVSLGEGHIVTHPPEIKAVDATGTVVSKPYASERVRLPVLDRDTAATGSDDLTDVQSTMKFHRLHRDRPVRPFIMRACLSNSSDGVYHRTLSFHPPLVIHNMTAGPLEFCLATPNDWTPAADATGGVVRAHEHRWEDAQQRLRERGTINVADSVIWHLSDSDTPLELSVRMKGFEWSEPVLLGKETADVAQIRMKDLVTDSLLYVTAEFEMKASKCREIFLFVPYWIVNLTGLKLEYEFDDERTGSEHPTTYVPLSGGCG